MRNGRARKQEKKMVVGPIPIVFPHKVFDAVGMLPNATFVEQNVPARWTWTDDDAETACRRLQSPITQ